MSSDNVRWFTGGAGSLGVVRVLDLYTGEFVYYIGVCIKGNTEEEDRRNIHLWGASFPEAAGRALFEDKPW